MTTQSISTRLMSTRLMSTVLRGTGPFPAAPHVGPEQPTERLEQLPGEPVHLDPRQRVAFRWWGG
jgi:hypothetical protein